jgi:K+-transporting ATPase KdpF subunit
LAGGRVERSPGRRAAVSVIEIVALVAAVGLLIYLSVALLNPERFE